MPRDGNAGPRTGRNRNTVRNREARGMRGMMAEPFPLGPQDNLGLGLQRDSLLYDNQIARASLRAQAQLARADYRYARSGAREQYRTDMAAVQGDMADRGILGGTSHVAGEANAFAARQGAVAEAQRARTGSLMQVHQGRLEALAALRRGMAQVAMQRAAMQRQMALAAFGSEGQNPWGF